jgi:hypothetical protein
MVIERTGKFINRRTRMANNKAYNRFFIYVPTDLAGDSAFPFKEGDEIIIKIDSKKRRLIIEKT